MDNEKLKTRLAEYEAAAREYQELFLLNTGAAEAIRKLLSETEGGEQPPSQEVEE